MITPSSLKVVIEKLFIIIKDVKLVNFKRYSLTGKVVYYTTNFIS